MDPVMSRPQARANLAASHTRRIVGMFVAFALSVAALIAMPQAAQAADVVDVPDANFKAVLNSAIAATDGSTRAPDQDITPAEALTVSSVGSYDEGTGVTIADFTGVEAFKNLFSLDVYNTAETISLDPLAGSSVQSLALAPADPGVPGFKGSISSDLSALGSIHGLLYLTLRSYELPDAKLRTIPVIPALLYFTAQNSGIVDVSPLAKVTSLESLDVTGNKIHNLSPIATMPGLTSLSAADNLISDISFVSDMKSLTSLSLSNNLISDISPVANLKSLSGLSLNSNLIEDVSALAPMADQPRSISVSSNRIADLSPLQGFYGNGSVGAGDQHVYVGPYQDGGVSIKLRDIRDNRTVEVTPSDAGNYDVATNRLVSNDPSAPFLDVVANTDVYQNWKVYFSEAPDKLAALRVNEVESNGDAVNGDWVELYNPGSTTVDISGLVVSDNKNTSKLIVPAGTKIPAKGYQTIVTENAAKAGPFGLGEADSVRIFAPGTLDLATATTIDSHSWTAHATTTFGRTVPGAGAWSTTSGGTFGAVNEFPLPTVVPTVTITGDATSTTGSAKVTATVTKPASTDLATDATGTVVFAIGGKDASGPVTVTGGKAEWISTGLAGSPSGTAHQVTARYVSAGDADPYGDSVASAAFTVTVTIAEFAGAVVLSTAAPQVCQTISSDVSGITPAPDTVAYQWQSKSNGQWSNLSGQTAATQALKYTIDGKNLRLPESELRLVVTASKAGHATKVFTSSETARVAAAPFVTTPAATLNTSTPKVGETITATHPEWTTCVPAELNWKVGYDYQWLRDGKPIVDAADATDAVAYGVNGPGPKQVSYAATPADAGHTISLRVTSNSLAIPQTIVASSETSAVTAGAFTTAPAPVIDNTSPIVGDTLNASAAAWSPAATFTWQWLRDGQEIGGATAASYATTDADQGRAISVRVTGAAVGYADSKTSAATAAVVAKPTPPAPPTPPTPGATPVNKPVSSKYSVKVTAQSGKKLRLSVTAKGVPVSSIDKLITVKIAGVKGSYKVSVKNGKATINLGKKAKALKKGKKVTVTLSLAKLTASAKTSAGTTTYTVAKATKKVKVKLK